MAEEDLTEVSDTLEMTGEPKSSTRVLSAIKKAEDAFRDYQEFCKRIDIIYSRTRGLSEDWVDTEYDLFWSSMEIIKPATYAKPPVPNVAPMFSDQRPLQDLTAELLERVTASAFDHGGMDEVMIGVRDDLAFTNRGQIWVTYESDEKGGGQRACIEHLDRTDFLHEPARKWSEVNWVARRAWMTKKEMRKRFRKTSGDAYQGAITTIRRDDKDNGGADDSKKAGVWEVWHKGDGQVYWVVDGVSVLLDSGEPHLKLQGFFPCPRPAYGTLRRRSLVPVPDYIRYQIHFDKIDDLTSRIYLLLDKIKLKGLIPAGGDIGNAVEQAMRSDDDELLIPVPAAALLENAGNFVQWMPIGEIAQAIQGLIEARGQLFEDFYQLSGISDIMRGATEADETLGAQRLKGQYGSVRVRGKISELQRIARDVARIVAEVAAEKFSQKTLLDMSQMEIPTKSEIQKQIEEIEKAAEREIKAVSKQAKDMIDQARTHGQQIDQQQAQQQFQQAQQQIAQKYAPQLAKVTEQIPIDDVVSLLRDDRTRGFTFEIATDSTVMTDELEEKASRNEFLDRFSSATAQLVNIASLGEPGAALAGGILKFVMEPYRPGRSLQALIDKFIEAAPQMAEQVKGQGGEAEKAMAEANQKLAEAELQKAQAAIAKVQADTAKSNQEIQLKAAEAQSKAHADQQRIALEMEQTRGSIAETNARVEKIMAEIQKIGVDASNQTRQQDREDVKTVASVQAQHHDQSMQTHDRQRQAFESDRTAAMSERQQNFSERSGERQMTLAERQAQEKPDA